MYTRISTRLLRFEMLFLRNNKIRNATIFNLFRSREREKEREYENIEFPLKINYRAESNSASGRDENSQNE